MTLDSLRSYGADVDDGLQRCMGMEDFYLEMIELGLADDRFENLGQVLKDNNMDEAFEMAHALKGVIGNLALTPLYDTLCEVTEHLRKKDAMDYTQAYAKLMEQRQQIINL
ncbi:Hpt domain-containing protein [Butyrivibrio sp. FCS014]|uniref:Hpt domain-containing protein n=1 Tax=Butyrivibrio sp. FCS014 TaxID=1408304 RepID=UPI0004643F46|nr:Hpt domain-containing protein [Butyrivibrio sp. FCS014]